MSSRLRLSVETILRLTPEVLGSTVFSIARVVRRHACLDDQALLAAREAIGSSLDRVGASLASSSQTPCCCCSFCLGLNYFMARNKGLDEAKARQVPRWDVRRLHSLGAESDWSTPRR